MDDRPTMPSLGPLLSRHTAGVISVMELVLLYMLRSGQWCVYTYAQSPAVLAYDAPARVPYYYVLTAGNRLKKGKTCVIERLWEPISVKLRA